VQWDAARELVDTEHHGLVARLSGGAVILPAEGDAPFVEGQQSLFEIATQYVTGRRRLGKAPTAGLPLSQEIVRGIRPS
jgi:hypothetical protein